MAEITSVGAFCPNTDCPDYGHVEHARIIRFGFTKQNKQRFRCKSCGKTFNENHGTLFYGKRYADEEIIETLALLAEGSRISSLARTKHIKEDTILAWLREAARHAEAISDRLLRDYGVGPAQVDGLWSYVGHKGEKKTTPRPRPKGRSGARA